MKNRSQICRGFKKYTDYIGDLAILAIVAGVIYSNVLDRYVIDWDNTFNERGNIHYEIRTK